MTSVAVSRKASFCLGLLECSLWREQPPGKPAMRLASWQGHAQVLLKTLLAELSHPVIQVCVKLSWILWTNLSFSWVPLSDHWWCHREQKNCPVAQPSPGLIPDPQNLWEVRKWLLFLSHKVLEYLLPNNIKPKQSCVFVSLFIVPPFSRMGVPRLLCSLMCDHCPAQSLANSGAQ